jgi:hypothetical protein
VNLDVDMMLVVVNGWTGFKESWSSNAEKPARPVLIFTISVLILRDYDLNLSKTQDLIAP